MIELSTDQLVFMLRASQSEGVKEGRKQASTEAATTYLKMEANVARDALAIMEHAKVEVLALMGRSKNRQKVGWLLDESFKNLRGLTD